MEIFNDFGLALLVDTDAAEAHFKGGGLERQGEFVGLAGGVVELG